MGRFNDLDLSNWKECDINTDSLWLVDKRDNSGKHKNIYHGNFIPQILYQLIKRYTKENEIVLEPFMGSGTTLFECEKLNRKYIGFDINEEIFEYVKNIMKNDFNESYEIFLANSLDKEIVTKNIQKALQKFNLNQVQHIIIHPPYMDIVKFTDKKEDLSQIDITPPIK